MAVVKKNTYVTGGDLTNVVNNVDYNRLGTEKVTVEDDTTNVTIKVGSLIECNGSLYAVESSDVSLAKVANGYLYFDDATQAFLFDTNAPTWQPSKNGYYYGTTYRATRWRIINTSYLANTSYGDKPWNGFAAGNGSNADQGGGAVGNSAISRSGGAVGNSADTAGGGAIGNGSDSLGGGAVGLNASTDNGGAVGQEAESTNNGGAVGWNASTGSGCAVGYGAVSGSGAAIGATAIADGGADIAIGNGADTSASAYHVFQMTGFPINGFSFTSSQDYDDVDTALDSVLDTSLSYGVIISGGDYAKTWRAAVYLERNTTWQLYDASNASVVNFSGSIPLSADLFLLVVGE